MQQSNSQSTENPQKIHQEIPQKQTFNNGTIRIGESF